MRRLDFAMPLRLDIKVRAEPPSPPPHHVYPALSAHCLASHKGVHHFAPAWGECMPLTPPFTRLTLGRGGGPSAEKTLFAF